MHKSTEDILEAFLLSDQTIAIDFDKFEAGGRLFIVGLSGSGKTSLGNQIAKKYKAPMCALDSAWHPWMGPHGSYENMNKDEIDKKFKDANKKMKQMVSDKRGCRIVEGIQIVFPKLHEFMPIFMREACIIMGKSQIMSALDAGIRNKKAGFLFFKSLKNQFKTNQDMKRFLARFRKVRSQRGKNIQPFKI